VNALKMMKQLKEMKKIQKQLSKKVVEVTSPDGSVTVRASADMSVKSIKLKVDNINSDGLDRLGKTIASTVNSAFDSCKHAAADDMAKLTDGMGLGDMFGGR